MTKKQPEMQTIQQESSPYKYFTMMLNMAEDDLNPHEYRLLAHYVRWAGHGGVHKESVRAIAKTTQMGKTTIDKTRDKLEAKGYIKVTKPTEDERKEGVPTQVLVLDRWAENINRYAKGVPNQVHGVDPNKDTGVPEQVQGGVPNQVDSEEQGLEEPHEEIKESPLPPKHDIQKQADEIVAKVSPPISDEMAAKLLINSYLKVTRSADVKMLDSRDRKREASILYDDGMRPFHIETYIKRLKTEEFWRDRNVTWPYLIKNIVSHFETRPPVLTVFEPEIPIAPLPTGSNLDDDFELTYEQFDKMLEAAAEGLKP